MSTSIAEQLQSIKPNAISTGSYLEIGNLKPLHELGQDGEDHCNIYIRGTTALGRSLSHSSRIPFTHKFFGRFLSIDGFWTYIRTLERDDYLRTVSGYKIKQASKKYTYIKVPNFSALIVDASYQKIVQYPRLAQDLKNLQLPLDSYFMYNESIRIRPTFAPWILSGMNEIKSALMEDKEPDFKFLLDINTRCTTMDEVYQEALNAVKNRPVYNKVKVDEL